MGPVHEIAPATKPKKKRPKLSRRAKRLAKIRAALEARIWAAHELLRAYKKDIREYHAKWHQCVACYRHAIETNSVFINGARKDMHRARKELRRIWAERNSIVGALREMEITVEELERIIGGRVPS